MAGIEAAVKHGAGVFGVVFDDLVKRQDVQVLDPVQFLERMDVLPRLSLPPRLFGQDGFVDVDAVIKNRRLFSFNSSLDSVHQILHGGFPPYNTTLRRRISAAWFPKRWNMVDTISSNVPRHQWMLPSSKCRYRTGCRRGGRLCEGFRMA